jgi:hypothetical protein
MKKPFANKEKQRKKTYVDKGKLKKNLSDKSRKLRKMHFD